MLERLVSSFPSYNKPSTKKRLLFLRRTIAFGGSEVVVMDLLKAIDYETNDVFLASTTDVFSERVKDLGLPVTCLPLTAPFQGRFFGMFMSWIRYLIGLRPDQIVLAEGGFGDFSLSAALAAFAIARGNVWMMELHPPPEPTKEPSKDRLRLVSRLGLRERASVWLPKGILSVSQGVKDRLVRGYGYAPEKISVVYNGVDTTTFSPVSQDTRRALRRELRIPDEAVVIVSASRLDPIKRLDRLIQAFGALSIERKDLRLLLTGEGPLRDELESLARSVDRAETIRFLGHVKDVRTVLRASDIYVLPSDEEGFGLSLAEAMACELVCVATKTIGPSEIIEHGLSGILTDLTYEGVLEGLDQALRLDSTEREVIGKRARQRVVSKFRAEESAAKGLTFLKINPAIGTAQ